MQEAADRLKSLGQSQLELTSRLCGLGLECCGRLTEINGQTVRALLAQAASDGEAWPQGGGTGFLAATGRIALDHWASTLACGVELQRQVLAGLLPARFEPARTSE